MAKQEINPLSVLCGEDLARYKEKLKLIHSIQPDSKDVNYRNLCPYIIGKEKFHFDCVRKWPELTYENVYEYLLNSPGTYNIHNNARRSLKEGFDYYGSGHVGEIWKLKKSMSGIHILKSTVRSSQCNRLNHVWIALGLNNVISCHCTCMAGLGETCCHISGTLYKINAATSLKINLSSTTDILSYWNHVSVEKVTASPVSEIAFIKARFDKEPIQKKLKIKHHIQLTKAEILQSIKEFNPTAKVLAANGVNESQPLPVSDQLKKFKKLNPNFSSEALLQMISVTKDEKKFIETLTRSQSSSAIWFNQRKFRITASIFHKVIHLRQDTIPEDLIQNITGSEMNLSHVLSIKWGRDKEKKARALYIRQNANKHKKFKLSLSGLHISEAKPYLAGSPDGIVTCECHGEFIVEFKCPFTFRDKDPRELVQHSDFYVCESNGAYHLKENHKNGYYHQIQMQLFVTGLSMCDFTIWTCPDDKSGRSIGQILTAIVTGDPYYITKYMNTLESFYIKHILPKAIRDDE